MKRILNPSEYTYTPSTNEIDFSGVSGFAARNLLAVISVTGEKVIFSTAGGASGLGGSFAGSVLTYDSSNVGQSPSDILQIIYDDPAGIQNVNASGTVNSQIYDYNGNGIAGIQDPATSEYFLAVDSKSRTNAADGTPIYSTYDAQSGEDGLNVNLLNSSFGGQLGSALPIPNNNSALSVGFLNSTTSTLVTPRMDPVTNELIVQTAGVPLQDVNLTQVNGSGIALGQYPMANSLPVTMASNQTAIPITTSSPIEVKVKQSVSQDVLGVAIGGNRNNQIEVSFNTAPGASLITNTFTGAGSVSITQGHSIYQTGSVGAAASAQAVTVQTTIYRPAHEIYAAFTAAFLNMIATRSDAKIGLFDTLNGFFVGYDITQGFGVGVRSAGTDSIIPRASWNTDLLNGNASSKFTRGGAPEAIDFALSNLFRIRFAWLGSANIFFEVFSPDAEWVLFHNIRQPNSNLLPSIENPNLPMTVRVSKIAGTQNSQIVTACIGAGTSSDLIPLDQVITDKSLVTLTRTVIEGKTTGGGGGGGFVPVKVTPSGALTVEATLSGTSAMNLSQYGGVATTLGQKVSASSIPVVVSSDQSSLNTALPDLYITGASNGAAGNNNLLAAAGPGELDVSGYKSASIQVISTATSGTFIFEGSNSTVTGTFQAIPAFRLDSVSPNAIATAITATATNLIYIIPVRFRYMRMRVVTGLSTPIQALTRLSQDPFVAPVVNVVNATGANLNATISGSLTSAGTVTQATPANLNCTAVVSGATLQSTAASDIVSAAITTTQTSANISQANIQTVSFAVFVTAISGAGAAMDVQVQETMDGTNFYTIYTFERITAIGQYYSPIMTLAGTGLRYIRTVSGTTPSITNSLNRIARQGQAQIIRRFINRTIDPNTLNSTTGSFFCDGAENFNLIVRCTAQTTAATIALEFSSDNTNWFTSSTTITTVVGVTQAKIENMQFKFVRAIVTAAGTGITLGEVTIGGHSV